MSVWDPEDVLQLCSDSRCVGYAPSRGRKCLMPIRFDNVMEVNSIIDEMAQQQPDAKTLRPTLVRLARHGLCVRFHQYQVEDMVEKWTRRITAAYPLRREPARHRSTRHEDEVAELQERLREMSQRLELLQAATQPSPSLSRVSTSNISSLHLSRTSTTTSNGTFNTRPAPTVPAPRTIVPISPTAPPHLLPTRHTFAPTSPVSRLASPFSPTQSPSQSAVSTTSMIAPTRSEPQASTSPYRTTTPPPPVASTTSSLQSTTPVYRCTRTHVRRIPYDDECPICYEGDNLCNLDVSEVVWCRSSCGRTVHKSCFEDWRDQCETTRRTTDCPVCRTEWEDDCDCLGCTIQHVEKRVVVGDCSICCQRMGYNNDDEEEEEEEDDDDDNDDSEDDDKKGNNSEDEDDESDTSQDDDEDEEEEEEEEELVWCKGGCGQSIHKDCFETWKTACEDRGRAATCVNCRAQWKNQCAC